MPMAPSTDTISQTQFTDSQDAKIDLDDLYNNLISIIDTYRSHVSVSANQSQINQFISALNTATQSPNSPSDPNQYLSQLVVSPTPQESRCSAFYRLTGLPVVSPQGLYSPGYDTSTSYLNTVLNTKAQILNSIDPAVFTLMDAREAYINALYSVFAQSNPTADTANINASVLALSSVAGNAVRPFTISSNFLSSSNPFDTNQSDFSYSISQYNTVGTAQLSQYQDVNGNTPFITLNALNLSASLQNPLQQRAHFIKPFMTDPRVDITLQPPKARICAPFITNSSQSVYAGDTTSGIVLIRPFIEYVMTTRFSVEQTSTLLPARYQAIQQYVQNTQAVNSQDLLTAIIQPLATTIEDQQFLNNFNIMRAMIDRLYNAKVEINQTEIAYHWDPIPDPVYGLEGDIGTQSILIQQLSNGTVQLDPLATTIEKTIMTYTATAALSNPNIQPASPDLGSFAFQSIQPLPDSMTTSGFGSQNQNSLDNLTTQRTNSTNKAAAALRDIEIIMGEFTGFGLSDAIAIYAALWTIDPNTLVYMIDDNAFNRMTTLYPNLASSAVSTRSGGGSMSAQTVLQNFETQVKLMYSLMDSLYATRALNQK